MTDVPAFTSGCRACGWVSGHKPDCPSLWTSTAHVCDRAAVEQTPGWGHCIVRCRDCYRPGIRTWSPSTREPRVTWASELEPERAPDEVLLSAACPVCDLTISEALPQVDSDERQYLLSRTILADLGYSVRRHKITAHDELDIVCGIEGDDS